MGYDQSEKVMIKLQFLRMLLKLELDPARQQLVAGIFENYFKLSTDEENELRGQLISIPKNEVSHIMELMTSWERKGLEKGIEQGIEKGKIEGKIEGKAEVKSDIARRMLKKGFSLKEISEITGLSESELNKLKV